MRLDSRAVPRRIPKLAVRNKAPEHDNYPASGHHTSGSSGEDESPQTRVSCQEHTDDELNSLHARSSCDLKRVDSKQDESRSKHASKRKSTSVLGFFTLKEPSTSALEEFAEAERKKLNAQRGTKLLPGVSSQKIPQHVPRVNSKWDGLPDAARRKQGGKDKSMRNSMISLASRNSDASEGDHDSSAKRIIGSLSSKPSIRRSGDKGRKLAVSAGEGNSRPQSHSAGVRPSSPSASFALDPNSAITPPDELSELPVLQHCGSSSGHATPPETSPPTSALDSNMPRYQLPGTGFTKKSEQGHGGIRHRAEQPAPAVRPQKKDDVAPWEMFEPPPEIPQRTDNAASGYRKPKRFGAKLGLR